MNYKTLPITSLNIRQIKSLYAIRSVCIERFTKSDFRNERLS